MMVLTGVGKNNLIRYALSMKNMEKIRYGNEDDYGWYNCDPYYDLGCPTSSEGDVHTRDALLSREELHALTGTKQPKRMCLWLQTRGWIHEPPARRGDIPKVLRSYRDSRLSAIRTRQEKRANYSFMTGERP